MTENQNKEPDKTEETEQKRKRKSIRLSKEDWEKKRPGKADGTH